MLSVALEVLARACSLQAPQEDAHIVVRKAKVFNSISGLVVEYIVVIDVTRVRFPGHAELLIFD